ncbi:hypothetical protein FACS189459_2010 [Bacilli bacterium]|nr:hypothetical protein FACS189459_2010 [Bacilli bacterium]
MYTTPEGNNVPQLFRTIESSNGGVQYGFVDESHCGNIYRINGLNDEQIESTIK